MKRRARLSAGVLFAAAWIIGPAALVAAAGPAGDRVWVAAEGGDRVVQVDVGARRVVERVRTPGGPHNITVAPNGTVVVALWGSDMIAIVKHGDARFVDLGGAPHDVKISGNLIVVANQGSSRVQLVRLDGHVTRRVLLSADPHDVAVDPSGRRAWVTLDGTDDLAVVNLVRRAPVRYVSTGRQPHDILFAPDGTLWVTDWSGTLDVFSAPRGRLIDTLPLGTEAHHLAFTPNGRLAWITDHGSDRVFVLRVSTRKVVASMPFPGEPHHVAVTSDGRFVVVADHANSRLIVYKAATRHRVGSIRVGAGPHGVWAVP